MTCVHSPSRVPSRADAGQGSLEYLLLIAGALLVVMIVLLIAFALSPFGEQVFNTNLVEYQHIDLCTGAGAECNFSMDWGAGLSSSPYGMVLSNDSDWRTLAVTGVEVALLCGDSPCDASLVEGSPSTSLEIPISLAGCTPTSGNHVVCPYCDVATASCYNTGSLFFCPLSGVGSCATSFDFPGIPDPMVTLPPSGNPLSMQKVAISAARINSPFVTGIRYNFFVSRVTSSNNLADAGLNSSFSLSFHRSGRHTLSEYSCTSASPTAFSGCAHGPECVVTPCSINYPEALAYCTTLGAPLPDYVCRTGPGDGDFAPFDAGNCITPSPSGVVSLASANGGVIRSNLPSLGSGGQFVGSLPNGLVFTVRNGTMFDFQSTPSPGQCTFGAPDDAAADAACRAACQGLAPQLSALRLYDLSSVSLDSPAICDALNTAPPSALIPIEDASGALGGSVSMSGGCFSGDDACSPYCYADYRFSQHLTANARLGRDAVIGFRMPGPSSLEMIGSYSGQFVPAVGGVFYSP